MDGAHGGQIVQSGKMRKDWAASNSNAIKLQNSSLLLKMELTRMGTLRRRQIMFSILGTLELQLADDHYHSWFRTVFQPTEPYNVSSSSSLISAAPSTAMRPAACFLPQQQVCGYESMIENENRYRRSCLRMI